MKFKIGDRVRYISSDKYNKVGTIIDQPMAKEFLIQFDQPFVGGHSGCGLGKDKHCWWVYIDHVELVNRKRKRVYKTIKDFNRRDD